MAKTTARPPVAEWGADAAPENRPGVPREKETATASTAPKKFAQQRPRLPVINKRVDLKGLTPVFGTAQPARGLSGLIRKAAYAIPDNRAQHWMLLMTGDRVDVLESTLGDIFTRPSAGLFITLGAAAAMIGFLRRRTS
jgi:hypothetical protein